MVVRAEVRVTEIACGFREREQIIERALLACERDQRKVYTELHVSTSVQDVTPRSPPLSAPTQVPASARESAPPNAAAC